MLGALTFLDARLISLVAQVFVQPYKTGHRHCLCPLGKEIRSVFTAEPAVLADMEETDTSSDEKGAGIRQNLVHLLKGKDILQALSDDSYKIIGQ